MNPAPVTQPKPEEPVKRALAYEQALAARNEAAKAKPKKTGADAAKDVPAFDTVTTKAAPSNAGDPPAIQDIPTDGQDVAALPNGAQPDGAQGVAPQGQLPPGQVPPNQVPPGQVPWGAQAPGAGGLPPSPYGLPPENVYGAPPGAAPNRQSRPSGSNPFRPEPAYDPSKPRAYGQTPVQGQAAPADPYAGQPPYPGEQAYPGQEAYPGQNPNVGQQPYPGQDAYAGQTPQRGAAPQRDQYGRLIPQQDQSAYPGQEAYNGQADPYAGQNSPYPGQNPPPPGQQQAYPGQAPYGQPQEEWVQVIVSGTGMRDSASEEAPVLFAFPYGRNLKVVSRNGEWVEVADPKSETSGWMQAHALAPSAGNTPYSQGAYYEEPQQERRGLFRRGGFGDMINRAFGGRN